MEFAGSRKIQAVLLYEQWGWPLKEDIQSLKAQFIILDKVDSADVERSTRINGPEVFSLSKLLGLPGGALVRKGGRFRKAHYNPSHRDLAAQLGQDALLMDIYKSEVDWPHPKLEKWLKKNSLTEALSVELKRRRENLAVLLHSGITKGWPEWMIREAKNGIGPGLAPAFRGKSVKNLAEIRDRAARDFGLETAVYHFNWSGDPFRPDYRSCLALPLHGQMEDLERIVYVLEKRYGTEKNAGRHTPGGH
jgi:hypothetical protein